MHLKKRIPLTREDKVREVIELHKMGKNIRYISKKVHMSFSDIGAITRKFFGDDEQRISKKYSIHSQALQLFQRGYTKLQVAIELGLSESEIIEKYKQFMVLNGFDGFCDIYDQMAGDLGLYLVLHQELKLAGVSVRDAIEGVKVARQLHQLKPERDGLLRDVVRLKSDKNKSLNELEDLERKKNSVLGILQEARAAVWNEIAMKERVEETRHNTGTRIKRVRIHRNNFQ